MLRVKVVCGCGHTQNLEYPDGKEAVNEVKVAGICPECMKNIGDYTKSSYWRHHNHTAR